MPKTFNYSRCYSLLKRRVTKWLSKTLRHEYRQNNRRKSRRFFLNPSFFFLKNMLHRTRFEHSFTGKKLSFYTVNSFLQNYTKDLLRFGKYYLFLTAVWTYSKIKRKDMSTIWTFSFILFLHIFFLPFGIFWNCWFC